MKLSRYEQETVVFLSEIIRQLPQTEGSQYRAEGTGKADDDCNK